MEHASSNVIAAPQYVLGFLEEGIACERCLWDVDIMDAHCMAVQDSGRTRKLNGGPQSLGARQVDAAKGALSTHMHVQI